MAPPDPADQRPPTARLIAAVAICIAFCATAGLVLQHLFG